MPTAKVFKTGRSQAVRLPKEYRFSGRQVRIARIDDMVILYAPKKGWSLLERATPYWSSASVMTEMPTLPIFFRRNSARRVADKRPRTSSMQTLVSSRWRITGAGAPRHGRAGRGRP